MGRYDLGDFVGQGNNGRVFRSRDLAREQRTVAVKVLHADVLASDGERTRLDETLAKLRRAPHPHLIEVESFEQTPACRFLVQEWVSGFTLVDLLRSRGQLPVRETLQLLAQTAAGADHAFGHELDRLELGLHQILVHFPTVAAGSQAGRALLGTPVDKWPDDFSLKLDALGITREAGDSVTWGGDMTMMPSAPMLGPRHADEHPRPGGEQPVFCPGHVDLRVAQRCAPRAGPGRGWTGDQVCRVAVAQ